MKPASFLAALCLFCLLLPGAAAISISHTGWENPLLYVPGEEYTFGFEVSNYGYDATIGAEGDWGQYVTFSEITSPRPGVKKFTATVSPPEVPDTPGMHYVYIRANDMPTHGGGSVGAVVNIRKQITFKVLYSFKWISTNLVAPDVNIGEPVHFRLSVASGTLQTIREVQAAIEVTDTAGAVVATLQTNSVTLKLGEAKTLTATLDTTGLKPATYHAKAAVTYDGNVTTAEDDFRIGTLAVHIVNYTRQVEAGTISPFTITIKSGWNDPIENVYGEMYIDQKQVMKTPTTGLGPWEEKNLTGYVDAAGWLPGQYNDTIVLHFGDKSAVEMSELLVTEKKEASGGWFNLGWTHLLIAGIVLLIVILTANIFILTRQRDRKAQKKRKRKKR